MSYGDAMTQGQALDLEAFYADLRGIRASVHASVGEADLAHLRKVERWGRVATLIGVATAWLPPNPVSIVALAMGRTNRWLLMHHIGHHAYDRVRGVPARHTSRVFARGWRRAIDWVDCFLPAAWRYEHMLHHSYTSEDRDPDVFERNTDDLRALPRPLRYALLALLAVTWRASYYTPKTLRTWYERTAEREEESLVDGPPGTTQGRRWRELLLQCYLPWAGTYFVLFPLLFFPFGAAFALNALLNSLLAEPFSNLHTFLVIGPNHTGDDLVRFRDRPRSHAEHALRQIVASTNYRTGGDLVDWAHLWLNYQIEHHLWPDLPMLRYREVQPRVRALCERYGIPYVQESVFTRFRKMLRVLVGDAPMTVTHHGAAEWLTAQQRRTDDTEIVVEDRRAACHASL